jgi:hypothetical protein
MADSAENQAALREERLAAIMEDTEARMHSTANLLPSPRREALHRRANRLSERAMAHLREAERLRRRAG